MLMPFDWQYKIQVLENEVHLRMCPTICLWQPSRKRQIPPCVFFWCTLHFTARPKIICAGAFITLKGTERSTRKTALAKSWQR